MVTNAASDIFRWGFEEERKQEGNLDRRPYCQLYICHSLVQFAELDAKLSYTLHSFLSNLVFVFSLFFLTASL